MLGDFDLTELVKRAIKYIVEGIIVALAAYAIPKQSLKIEEVVIIALTAAATFSVLDVFIPSMGSGARGGASFAIGTGLAGGLKIAGV
jgi:ABC-type Co2+ transport system permease subunit